MPTASTTRARPASRVPTAALTAIAPLFLFGACTGADGLGPRDLAGVYVLQRVNGQTLPATLYDGTRYGGTVYADTLTLRPDGTLAQVWCLGHTQGPSTTTARASGMWRVAGSSVALTYSAAPNGVASGAVAQYTGEVGAGNVLAFSVGAVGTDAVYARP